MSPNERQIQQAIDSLDWIQPCPDCGMRYCVGDYECPHCGADLYDNLRAWAEALTKRVMQLAGDDSEGG